MPNSLLESVGIVVIGRNEGERLRKSLLSVLKSPVSVVYVDSGSSDDSVAMARSMGISVVELDMSIPFTAARARNNGREHLLKDRPDLAYVQFLDGDCEVAQGWLETAAKALEENSEVAVVCGRRRERFPDKTIYNKLCDMEWDTPVGELTACGGDSMMRLESLDEVGGFNPNLIAGEEPELCFRIRAKGGRILRLDAEMTLHDADMTRFSQWWKRGVRAGHAYTERRWMHKAEEHGYMRRQTLSIWAYGFVLPILVLALAWPTNGGSVVLLLIYALLGYRVFLHQRRRDTSRKDAALYALSCVLAKFSQAVGQIKFHLNRLAGRRTVLIEYK